MPATCAPVPADASKAAWLIFVLTLKSLTFSSVTIAVTILVNDAG